MHIAHIAPEMAPFVKIGGLGDVVGSLPAAQVRDGRQVSVVLPGYGPVVGSWGLAGRAGTRVAARYAGREIVGAVHELERQGVRVLVVAQDELFNRPGIYGGPEGSYGDNGLRFAWFCAAAPLSLGSLLTLLAQSFFYLEDFTGQVVRQFTLSTYGQLFTRANLDIIARTAGMAAAVTLAAILLAISGWHITPPCTPLAG